MCVRMCSGRMRGKWRTIRTWFPFPHKECLHKSSCLESGSLTLVESQELLILWWAHSDKKKHSQILRKVDYPTKCWQTLRAWVFYLLEKEGKRQTAKVRWRDWKNDDKESQTECWGAKGGENESERETPLVSLYSIELCWIQGKLHKRLQNKGLWAKCVCRGVCICTQAAWWEGSIPWFVNSEAHCNFKQENETLCVSCQLCRSHFQMSFLSLKRRVLAYLSNCHSSQLKAFLKGLSKPKSLENNQAWQTKNCGTFSIRKKLKSNALSIGHL